MLIAHSSLCPNFRVLPTKGDTLIIGKNLLAYTMIKVTLRDLAEKTGFSKTTVSLALRDHPKIPEPTRILIHKKAKELKYRPDPVFSRLASNRWRHKKVKHESVIAFITSEKLLPGTYAEYIYTEAKRKAYQLGYRLESFDQVGQHTPRQLARILYNRGVSGILTGDMFERSYIEAFPWDKFTVVASMVPLISLGIHTLMPNHTACARIAWEKAIERGYTRIGVTLFEECNSFDNDFRTGAHLLMRREYANRSEEIPFHIHLTENGVKPLIAWIQKWQPDVILGFNEFFYWELFHNGYRIPKDFGFIDLYGIANRRLHPINCIDVQMDTIIRHAMEILDSQIRAGAIGFPQFPMTVLVEPTWCEGITLPDKK